LESCSSQGIFCDWHLAGTVQIASWWSWIRRYGTRGMRIAIHCGYK
jgi:hypothetical protein